MSHTVRLTASCRIHRGWSLWRPPTRCWWADRFLHLAGAQIHSDLLTGCGSPNCWISKKNKVSASPLCLCVYVNLCLCASSYLSRPYLIVPIKARDFSPFILGYLACWNAASITFVVFSFTARGMQRHQHKGKCKVCLHWCGKGKGFVFTEVDGWKVAVTGNGGNVKFLILQNWRKIAYKANGIMQLHKRNSCTMYISTIFSCWLLTYWSVSPT